MAGDGGRWAGDGAGGAHLPPRERGHRHVALPLAVRQQRGAARDESKLPGAKSAGRVQSVALRLICEREIDIEKFTALEYWTVDTDFLTPENKKLPTRLTVLEGKKQDKFTLANDRDATDIDQCMQVRVMPFLFPHWA